MFSQYKPSTPPSWRERHPIVFVLAVVASMLALALAIGTVLHFAVPHAPSFTVGIAVDGGLAVLGVAIVLKLGWMRAVGFVGISHWTNLKLYVLPIAAVVASAAVQHSFLLSGVAVFSVLALMLIVGLAEETLFRGVILQALLPIGVAGAAVLSSVLFAAFHLLNVAGGASLGFVALQLVVAFCMGLVFVALRLRTGTIWPLIAIHAAFDYLSYAATNGQSGLAAPTSAAVIASLVISLTFLGYAIYLLRHASQARPLSELALGQAKV